MVFCTKRPNKTKPFCHGVMFLQLPLITKGGMHRLDGLSLHRFSANPQYDQIFILPYTTTIINKKALEVSFLNKKVVSKFDV